MLGIVFPVIPAGDVVGAKHGTGGHVSRVCGDGREPGAWCRFGVVGPWWSRAPGETSLLSLGALLLSWAPGAGGLVQAGMGMSMPKRGSHLRGSGASRSVGSVSIYRLWSRALRIYTIDAGSRLRLCEYFELGVDRKPTRQGFFLRVCPGAHHAAPAFPDAGLVDTASGDIVLPSRQSGDERAFKCRAKFAGALQVRGERRGLCGRRLAKNISRFGGNLDLGIAAWTLGDGGANKALQRGGMNAVRDALLSAKRPDYGTVGGYIDFIESLQETQ